MKLVIHRDKIVILMPTDRLVEWRRLCERVDKKNNGYMSITLDAPKRPRTTGELSQNHMFNGCIQQICVETGNDFGVVKTEVKHRALKRGYPLLMRNGKPVLDLYGREMGISEVDSSVEECALLIDEVIQLASELGVRLKYDQKGDGDGKFS